jgi:hypothetical protein
MFKLAKISLLCFLALPILFLSDGCVKDKGIIPSNEIIGMWNIANYTYQSKDTLTFASMPFQNYQSMLFNSDDTGIIYGKTGYSNVSFTWSNTLMSTYITLPLRGFSMGGNFAIQNVSSNSAMLVQSLMANGFNHQWIVSLSR